MSPLRLEIIMSKTTIIFGVDHNSEYENGFMINLSSLRFWEEEQCLPDNWEDYDDQELVERVTKKVGLVEEMESCWRLRRGVVKTPEEIAVELEAEGFVRHADFEKFNNGYHEDIDEEED